jgi:hypothetical protein
MYVLVMTNRHSSLIYVVHTYHVLVRQSAHRYHLPRYHLQERYLAGKNAVLGYTMAISNSPVWLYVALGCLSV